MRHRKDEIIHKKIFITKSPINGFGIFAKKNIKKGETIAVIKGKEVFHIVKDKKTSAMGPDWIGMGHNRWIDPNPLFQPLNHSCNPSAGIKGSRTLVALRSIKKEEEVTIDYAITEEDLLWSLDAQCNCGFIECRKKIQSIQFLPKKIFQKYLPSIGRYFQKVYLRYTSNG